jgi:aspartate kinase
MELNAEEIEIWTDVDGMMTADPKRVKNAKLIVEISFAEAAELAYFGAKVLHPATIQPVLEKNIPVRILNSRKIKNQGTWILPDVKVNHSVIRSISCKENIKVLNIFSTRMFDSYGFLQRIFEVFAKYKTPVDVITTSEVSVSLTVDDNGRIDKIINELAQFSTVSVDDDKSLVCVVGKNLKHTIGIVPRVFNVLANFEITMISLGASVINFSFVISQNDLANILQKLHDEFFGTE